MTLEFFSFCICPIFYSKDRRKVEIMLQFQGGKVKQNGGGGVGSLYFFLYRHLTLQKTLQCLKRKK